MSDYSLQLARYLKQSDEELVLFAGHRGSPLVEKLEREKIRFEVIPLLPSGPSAFLKSWARLGQILKALGDGELCVWTFEGREHTLCALHRRANPALWKNKTLVRVRGQAARLRGNSFDKWLYTRATDRIVFASAKLAREAPFYFAATQARVQLYCAGDLDHKPVAEKMTTLPFFQGVPDIDFSHPTFLVVGRYDPVKGHGQLLHAFARAGLSHAAQPVQLIFVGESQNIRASALFENAKQLLGKGLANGTRYFGESQSGDRRVYIFDERVPNVERLMASAHFGVIPSLGSEVICRVAVEFLHNATPLISSLAGALPEVLVGTPSRLFASDSEPQLVDALEWAIEVARDDARHENFRDVCRRIGVERYSLSRFSDVVAWAQS